MSSQFILAALIMAFGMAMAGAGTYFYQWLLREPAMLRYDGKTLIHTFGHLLMSFFCGPFIMLQMGWRQEQGGALSLSTALIAAFVGFGWAFITGLLGVGLYISAIA